MTLGKYVELRKIAADAQRAVYAAKLALEGKAVGKRADLTGWTAEQKLERQRTQARESMRRLHARRRAERLEQVGLK